VVTKVGVRDRLSVGTGPPILGRMLPIPPSDSDKKPLEAIEVPKVTEIPPQLEPTTPDPFIEDDPAPPPPRRRKR